MITRSMAGLLAHAVNCKRGQATLLELGQTLNEPLLATASGQDATQMTATLDTETASRERGHPARHR
jgi:hypothetical protein